jgi:hypothetical protein
MIHQSEPLQYVTFTYYFRGASERYRLNQREIQREVCYSILMSEQRLHSVGRLIHARETKVQSGHLSQCHFSKPGGQHVSHDMACPTWSCPKFHSTLKCTHGHMMHRGLQHEELQVSTVHKGWHQASNNWVAI